MQGDIADFVLGDVGALDRQCHGARRLDAVGIQPHAVISVTGRSVAQDLAVDLRAAAERALPFFENQHPCAFAEHEAVAGSIKGPRRVLRVRVVGRRNHAA